ncbi:MAG: SdrD B-like domain-containing protein [Akkermansiaceae bacterium]
MAASGFENEKFNGDYGASFGLPIANTELTLDKTVDVVANASPGNTLAYSLNFTNPGSKTVGDPDIGMPLVIQDSIPPGTKYKVGTAAANNILPIGVTSYEIRYSSNGGTTWTTTAPANQTEANTVTDIQWWLSDKLGPGNPPPIPSGTVRFSVIIDSGYVGSLPIVNVAGLSFGNSDPFIEDNAFTTLTGSFQISGTVFLDNGGTGGIYGDGIINGTEAGIGSVTTRLYYDTNNNNVVDEGDLSLGNVDTVNGNYSFNNLPSGEYIVQVERQDAQLTGPGYTPTSVEEIAITLSGNSTGNNFGFAPTLIVTKTGTAIAYPGQAVSYTIGVENKYGSITKITNYTGYPTALDANHTASSPAGKVWANNTNLLNNTPTTYSSAAFATATKNVGLTNFNIGSQSSSITGVQVDFVNMYKSGTFGSGDDLTIEVIQKPSTILATYTIPFSELNLLPLSAPTTTTLRPLIITAAKGTWAWADFGATSDITIKLTSTNGSSGGVLYLADTRVTLSTSETISSALSTIPLIDTYNSAELEFVSATDGGVMNPVGTITWSDITGGSSLASSAIKNVTVNFTAKALPGVNSITTTDTARVTGALFENGDPANDGEASAETEIRPLSSIGDTIFIDTNRSGSQDLSEMGVSGVTVQLYQGVNLIGTDVTDASGKYLFSNLIPGTYEVRVQTSSLPSAGVGWALSADPDLDGLPYDPINPNPLGDSRTTRSLLGGEFYAGADFGYYPPGYELSGTAWIDFDNDGLVDSSEYGIQYVTVNLYNGSNTLIGTTITDSEGAYTFVGLSNGNYRIEVITTPTPTAFPSNLTQTYDPDPTVNNQTNVTIAGADIENINFGYRYAGTNTLSGTIGMDTDPSPSPDGLLNGTNASGVAVGENALAGVTVYLYAWDDPDNDNVIDNGETVLLGEAITDANGDYSFSGLPASEFYLVSMAVPSNNLLITSETTTPNHPASLIVSSSNSQGHTTGAYAVVTAAASTTNIDFAFISAVDYDFGDLPATYSTLFIDNGPRHIRPVSPNLYLGASVSIEKDGRPSSSANLDTLDNGVNVTGIFWQNEDDGGGASVNVVGSGYLVGYIDFNNDGDFIDPGEYIPIQSVTTGTYNILIDIPAGTLDEDGSTGLYARFRLLPNQPFIPALSYSGEAANGEVEDYFWNFHSITGTVFGDADTDSIFSGGDIFVNGVQVQLWHNSVMIDSQVTGLDGTYSFYGLTSDNYEIRMVTPSGYNAILDSDGSSNGNAEIDISVTNATVTTRNFLLSTGGLFPNASLSGTVYIDTVNDNDFTGGDAVYSGVSVSLYRDLNNDGIADADELVGSVVTDSSGNYSFPNLSNGNYLVLPTTPTGYIKDADGIGNSNNKIAATIAGTNITGRNFLYDTNASISGNIKIDTTGDTAGETNQPGVTVQLLSSTNIVLATTTTDASGNYNFTIATAGSYKVRQVVPANYYAVGDVDGGNLEIIGDSALIVVANAANVTDQNFVNRELCSVGDFVWYDADEDGIKDTAELGINGVTVRLLNSSNLVIATTTTANNGSSQPGYYSFANLETGVYKIEFILPGHNYVFSFQNVDNLGLLAGGVNSDAALSTGRTNSFTLTAGLDVINVDAGIYETSPCPDNWTNWKQIHPSEISTGNPDADSYVNFTEFAFAMPYNNGIGNEHLDHTAWIVRESTTISNTVEGVFVRPKGAYLNTVYTLQYASNAGNPTIWTSIVIDTSLTGNATVVDNGDCTETVTILDLEGLTNLTSGSGVVRIKVDLDDNGGNNNIDLTTYVEAEGWTRTGLAGICQTYNIPYVRESVFTGTVSTVSGQDLIFDNNNLTSLLGSGSYYLEVTNGDHEGKRYDVSTTSGTGVTLLSDSNIYSDAPYNTTAGAPPSAATFVGDTVAIRRHWTLGDALPATDFIASSVPTSADQVQIFSNGGWATYWLNDQAIDRWVLLGDNTLADQAGVVIPPGYGMFFTRRGTATSNLVCGEIRDNDFIRPLQQGSNLMGGGYPVDQSPLGTGNRAMARGASGVGFFGSGDFKFADSIFVWKRDANPAAAGIYDTYYLAYASSISVDKWVRQSDINLTSQNAVNFMLDDRAVFIRSKENLPTYTIPSPWTP